MEEHSHLQMHPNAVQPKINFNIQELASTACSNIPGASDFINEYFLNDDSLGEDRIPRPETYDQVHHLGFGNVY